MKNVYPKLEGNDSYSGIKELWAIEGSLHRYNNQIIEKILSYLGIGNRILEFGAGIGTLAELWHRKIGVRPDCVEIDENLCIILEGRGFKCYRHLSDAPDNYDGIYLSNVLEHVEADVEALTSLKEKLKKGALIAIYVPAHQFLYSPLDKAVGHYRRYGMRELVRKVESAGFSVEYRSYSDSIGFFMLMVLKVLNKKRSENAMSNNVLLRIYDRFIFPISNILDCIGFKYIIGKNLFLVARRIT